MQGDCAAEKSGNFEIFRKLRTKWGSAHEIRLKFEPSPFSEEQSRVLTIVSLYSTGPEPTMLGPRFSIETDNKISEIALTGSIGRRKSPFYPEKQGDIIERANAPWEHRATADISALANGLIISKRIIFRFQVEHESILITFTDAEMNILQCAVR